MKLNTFLRAVFLAFCCPALLAPSSSHGQPSTNWTIGPKTILCIRMNCLDDASEPITESDAYAVIAGANQFIVENSYGAASLVNPVVTPVLTIPHTKDWFSHGFPVTAVWDVAAAAGFYRTNYDFDCLFSVRVLPSNSSNPGTKSIYMHNPSLRSVCHELGHVYGLSHSDAWCARGNSIIGPGQRVHDWEFDTMGGGTGHFSACFKRQLDWLPATSVQEVVSNGVFRLHAFDVPYLTNGFTYALKIIRGDGHAYWVEFRQQFTNNLSLMNGPLLSLDLFEPNEHLLLDMAPGYAPGCDQQFADAALLPNHTFSDTAGGVHITALPKNGTVPESIDVWVYLGFFTSNYPPTVVLTPSITNAAVGEVVSFSASALDPEGDELVYSWDFGDGRFPGTGPSVTLSWPSNGEYVVRCAVSDMKGGTASAAVLVRIGSPTTASIRGQVTVYGQPLDGVRVFVSPTHSTLTSSDGCYTLTGLTNGHYRLLPEKAYYQFSPTCLNLSVSNQSLIGADFTAQTNTTPNTAPLIVLATPLERGDLPGRG